MVDNKNNFNNILVDACMHLGDLIHATTVVPLLKEIYPSAKVSFLVNEGLESLFCCVDGVNNIIPYKYKSGGSYIGVYNMAKKIKHYNFDLSISLDPRTRLSAMMWLAKIPCRVGSPSVFGWQPGIERYFFNKYVNLDGYNFKKYPAAFNFQKLIKDFSCYTSNTQYIPKFVYPSEEAIKYVDLRTQKIQKDSLVVALCVNTFDVARNWNLCNYNMIVKSLLRNYNAFIIGVGVKADAEAFNKVVYGINNDRIIDLIGKTNFDQLNAVFKKCDLLINPDNGMGHFAAAAGCPTVTLFSNALPEKYKPLHPLTEVVSSNCECMGQCDKYKRQKCGYKCLDNLKVDDVLYKIERLVHNIR